MKRISFNEGQAEHIYEWLAMYWDADPKHGGCYECQQLGARLERFIGQAEVRRIRRVVKRNPAKKR